MRQDDTDVTEHISSEITHSTFQHVNRPHCIYLCGFEVKLEQLSWSNFINHHIFRYIKMKISMLHEIWKDKPIKVAFLISSD